MPIHSCYFLPSYLNSIPSSKCSFSNPSIRSSRLGFGASQLFHREKWIRSRNSTFVRIKHVIRASSNSDYYSTLQLKRDCYFAGNQNRLQESCSPVSSGFEQEPWGRRQVQRDQCCMRGAIR